MLSSKADSVRLYKTRKLISELQSKEGRGTELVSLYIPPRKPIHEVIAYLRNEWGTAGNIKSDTTRTHVQDALTKTMQRLKLYRETPENGLVIFAGALPTNGPGSEVVRLNEIVPPKPVHAFTYTCVAPDTRILLDDGTEKTIGALKGSWMDERVMSWSEENRRLVSNSIQDYLNIPVGGRKTYRLTVESGRSVLATEDHPFRTPRGWVRLGELRKGDIVCVLPLADIGPTRSTEREEKVVLDEEPIPEFSHPPECLSLQDEYLRIKTYLREESGKKAKMRTRQLDAEGMEVKEIGKLLLATRNGRASRWAQGNVQSPLAKSTQLASFEEWSRIARMDLEAPLLWESVVSIESEAISEVRDLTVSDSSHSFFANGFLVHNCDDHYHVEQLRDMLREDKVYGILAIDSSDVGMGILSGDSLEVVDVMTSGISGKTRKGGQCVGSDTIVQMEDGRLVPISSTFPGSRIASYNFLDCSGGTYQVVDTFTLVPREHYEIVSERPVMRISATAEHRFFTLSGDGVTTVEASRLKPGDKILVSRKLPEPLDPVLDTRFPVEYMYFVSVEGRRLLKDLRTEGTLSQSKLAGIVGLHQAEISQLERGERDLKWEKLRKIIRFLYRDVDEFLTKHVEIRRTLPEQFTDELLQLLGYIAGDGKVGSNRVVLYEYRIGVAKTYSDLAKRALGLEYVPIKKVDKRRQPSSFSRHHYLETRIYCKVFADALRQYYPGLISESREIPEQVQRLDNAHLTRFLRGLFDAEGNARKGRRIGITMKSGLLIKQLQLLLLRFGIVSSYSTYVNRYGSTIHSLDISDYDSLETFHRQIGFSSQDKQERLRKGLEKRRAQSYMSVPVVGFWMDKRAKELGIRRKQFKGITNFFDDQRGASRQVFRGVVQTFEDELTIARNSKAPTAKLQLLEETVSKLSVIEQSDLLLVRVKKVELVKNTGKKRFVDIELPTTRSFVGNGFVLHNSARRYERAREMELTYFFNRVAEHATRTFVNSNKVSGIIIGGPGGTKEDFIKGGYLHYQLQQNIISVIDTGYSGREGVREIVEKASDVLQDVRFVEEKKLVQRFLAEVNKPNGLAIYGLPRVMAALDKANVETVLVSDDVNMTKIKMTCKNCKTEKEEVVPNQKRMQSVQEMISTPCTKCGSTDYDAEEMDVVDLLEEKAIEIGAKVEVISGGTEEGNMFKSFGGTAAFVRYRG